LLLLLDHSPLLLLPPFPLALIVAAAAASHFVPVLL
jgi:hypothetical protein